MNSPSETKVLARGNYQRGICAECGRTSSVRLEMKDGQGTDLCNQHLSSAVNVMAQKYAQQLIMQRVQTIAEGVTLKFSHHKSAESELADLFRGDAQ